MEFTRICFAIFDPEILYKLSLSVSPLLRYNRSPELLPLMPFTVFHSLLRNSGLLPPRAFIPLPPFWRDRCFFPSFRPFRVSCTILSLVQFFQWRFLSAVPLLPGRSSLCRRQPISSRTRPSACSGFLRLHSGSYAASSVVRQVSLLHIP